MSLRRRVAAVVTIVVASTLAVAPSAGHAARDTGTTTKAAATRPAATEYAVGSRTVVLVDSHRSTDANGSYQGAPDRTLPVLVLYPATGTPGPATVPMAKPARRAGPFPLVVFSHGFTASGPAYGEWLLRRIAAHGYVVAAPTYPLSNGEAPGGFPKLLDYVNQPADVSFVITRMQAANRGRGPLAGLFDPKRIGAMGHSLGAITTLGATYTECCRDRRIRAAVPISGVRLPFGTSPWAWAWPPVPLLLIHGDQDRTVPIAGSTSAYREAKAPKFLVTLLAAPHTPAGAPYLDIIVNSTNAFFDRYLRGEKAALARLERDAIVPLASTLQADPR